MCSNIISVVPWVQSKWNILRISFFTGILEKKMPFKLKLKKSRQYNVSSKNLFVLSVELLDNTTVECTLSSQSLGQECLNNVCQRLGLQQVQLHSTNFLRIVWFKALQLKSWFKLIGFFKKHDWFKSHKSKDAL